MPPKVAASSPSRALEAILPLITSGQAYEAHQKARTFASRYVKAGQLDTAIQVLFQSARELLKAGHAGSGSDLGAFMLDVYVQKEQEVNDAARGNLTQLIALTGNQGVWRKTLIDKAIAWSAEFGWSPTGDPGLHYYIGELFYKEGAFDQAEPHLLAAGDRDSARLLAKMMHDWLPANGSPAPFATRGVLPFLLTQNILAARTFLSSFITMLTRSRPSLLLSPSPIPINIQSTPSNALPEQDELIATNDPTLNFLQIAIRVCQRADGKTNEMQVQARNAWIRLFARYKTRSDIVNSPALNHAAANIGHIYFKIPLPRQAGNPLQDMMASLFGGSPSASADTQPARRKGAIRARPNAGDGLD